MGPLNRTTNSAPSPTETLCRRMDRVPHCEPAEESASEGKLEADPGEACLTEPSNAPPIHLVSDIEMT